MCTGRRPPAIAHTLRPSPPAPAGKHGKKIAIIENEYGEVGIDDALVLDTKEEIFEVGGGVCSGSVVVCRVVREYLRAFGAVVEGQSQGNGCSCGGGHSVKTKLSPSCWPLPVQMNNGCVCCTGEMASQRARP